MKTCSDNSIQKAFQLANQKGLITESDTLVVFQDLAVLNDRISRLKSAFATDALHAVAIKANPLTFVLKHLHGLGTGLEAASLEEVYLAQNAGVEPEKIVFDSPAKTRQEIEILLRDFHGIRINADSLAELNRYPQSSCPIKLGLRINALECATSIQSMNVSGNKSKFGESIGNRNLIIDAVANFSSLDCLHIHAGSQFSEMHRTISAIRKVVDLALEVNQLADCNKITTLDIGGGFPVNYESGSPFYIEDYAKELARECPELFDGTFRTITEFGRYVHANACFAVSRIEYQKSNGCLITHAGADMLLRECYNPSDWYHEMSILGDTGEVKNSSPRQTDIAGPLCFGGDFIARDRKLPNAQEGDWLVTKDIGASTFSLWSRHCSRLFPKVIAFDSQQEAWELTIAKKREDISSVIDFWS